MTAYGARPGVGIARRLRQVDQATARPEPVAELVTDARPGLGYLPGLSVIAAAGLLLLASSYALAVRGSGMSEPLFWLGFLAMAAPITIRLASTDSTLAERLGLVIVLGMALYLASVVRAPIGFQTYDELLHFRSLTDVLASGRLFEANPLLTVSPLFPGLEIITAGVIQVSGADPFMAAVVVLGFVRVLFAVALFALYNEASGSERVAGLAAAIYMLNPNFTFFDSQFAYETLALPLVPVLLLAVALRARRTDSNRWLAGAVLAIGATIVITHHVTTYVTAAILGGWLFIHVLRRKVDDYHAGPIAAAAVVVGVGGLLWLLAVADETLPYLGAPLLAGAQELLKLIQSGEARVPFQSSTGQLAPLWERLAGLGAAGVLAISIPIGLIPLLAYLRRNSLALGLGLLSLGYPASLLGRLMPTASEAAGRSLAIIFLGLAFVTALAVLALLELPEILRDSGGTRRRWTGRILSRRIPRIAWGAGFVGAVGVLVLGGLVIGSSPVTRFPGPYLVGADSRSIDDESIDPAKWMGETLGPYQRVAADRVNRLLMGAYGDADVIFHGSHGVEMWQPFISPTVGPAEISRLNAGGVRYMVIDRRLSTSLPLVPFYYEEGEIFEHAHTQPISPAVLGKWDSVPGVDRVYDDGAVQIYRVDGLYRGQ